MVYLAPRGDLQVDIFVVQLDNYLQLSYLVIVFVVLSSLFLSLCPQFCLSAHPHTDFCSNVIQVVELKALLIKVGYNNKECSDSPSHCCAPLNFTDANNCVLMLKGIYHVLPETIDYFGLLNLCIFNIV